MATQEDIGMAETVRDVMTPYPITVPATSTVSDAARLMLEGDVGTIIVLKPDGRLCGMVTDRDIAVRTVARGLDPSTAKVDEICSHEDVVWVTPDTAIDQAVTDLRGHSVRRLPVVEGDRVVGIVSIGDLAMERDPGSALADISAAVPNR